MVAKIKALGEFGFAMINRALFVEKAQILKEDLGQDTVLYFIVGTDTLVRILDPKYYPKEGIQVALENLFGKAELICFNRMGFEEKDLVDRIASSGFGEKIHLLSLQDSSLELISSSQARELFHAGNISELSRILPDEVIEYCQSHNIYQ
jgi:nicotinamide-nucleotide adenylyltransferase